MSILGVCPTAHRALSARAIWAEDCNCTGRCTDWDHEEAWLTRIKGPDGVSYLAAYPSVTLMLRLDVLDCSDLDEWGSVLATEERQMDWYFLRPAARPSPAIFHRSVIEPLIAQGCSILPLERNLRLDHHPNETSAPHAVMWGEDHIGWICPANAEKVRERGTQANYVQAVTIR